MPKSLPANVVLEKNKLMSSGAWIVLVDVKISEVLTVHYTNNSENVSFGGETYIPVPFELDTRKEESQGRVPMLTLRISNVTRILQSTLEQLDGGVGMEVTIIVVHSDLLAEDYAELELTYSVIGCTSSEQWVVFNLGAPSPLSQRFPKQRYIPEHCNWIFKGVECDYDGTASTCNRTFAICDSLGNTARFGGYLGLRAGGIRIV